MVVLSNGVLKQLKTLYNILKCYKIDFNTIAKFVSCMPTYDLVSCPAMYIHYEMCAKGTFHVYSIINDVLLSLLLQLQCIKYLKYYFNYN